MSRLDGVKDELDTLVEVAVTLNRAFLDGDYNRAQYLEELEEYIGISFKFIREAYLSLMVEVIGEDEDTNPLDIWEENYYIHRNKLRAEQRKKASQIGELPKIVLKTLEDLKDWNKAQFETEDQ